MMQDKMQSRTGWMFEIASQVPGNSYSGNHVIIIDNMNGTLEKNEEI
jgi:hypothetical protein